MLITETFHFVHLKGVTFYFCSYISNIFVYFSFAMVKVAQSRLSAVDLFFKQTGDVLLLCRVVLRMRMVIVRV